MRATVISINQLYTRFIFSVFSPFLVWIVDVWAFEIAFYASALILGGLAVLALVSLLHAIHIREQYV